MASRGSISFDSLAVKWSAVNFTWRPELIQVRCRAGGTYSTRKLERCTGDELHYINVPGTDWKLALWRYLPSPRANEKNHPLLLLSGVGANALGYDLSPQSSFARFMSKKGFDTWILELRGSGLSYRMIDSGEADDGTIKHRISPLDSEKCFAEFSERISSYLEKGNNNFIASQIRAMSTNILDVMGKRKQSFSSLFDEPTLVTLNEFLNELDLLVTSDWDFDSYLEEDLPAAIEYVRRVSKPEHGKLMAIGHSMGGILLYAMLSRAALLGKASDFKAVITLGSTLDYSSSQSSTKILLPLVGPAEALHIPAIPLRSMAASAYFLKSIPPYFFSWLRTQISANDMLDPHLIEKFILNGVGTVSAKVLLQLATALVDGGLQNRSRNIHYKEHLRECQVPVLAIAGDRDPICPPEAVYETAKSLPRSSTTYRVFGRLKGPHYSHYDLVGSALAAHQVYPAIVDFLRRHAT